LRRDNVRTLGAILIWIGGVELFGSFLTKMIFDKTIPYSQVFVSMLLLGFTMWIGSIVLHGRSE
jgi:hypothetical protein